MAERLHPASTSLSRFRGNNTAAQESPETGSRCFGILRSAVIYAIILRTEQEKGCTSTLGQVYSLGDPKRRKNNSLGISGTRKNPDTISWGKKSRCGPALRGAAVLEVCTGAIIPASDTHPRWPKPGDSQYVCDVNLILIKYPLQAYA